MPLTASVTVRVPLPLRAQLAAVATAEQRSLSAVIVQLLDRGVVERAHEQALVREMVRADTSEAA